MYHSLPTYTEHIGYPVTAQCSCVIRAADRDTHTLTEDYIKWEGVKETSEVKKQADWWNDRGTVRISDSVEEMKVVGDCSTTDLTTVRLWTPILKDYIEEPSLTCK